MTMQRKISLLFILSILTLFTSSCNKRVHYNGTVLSRHLVPMPGVRVTITVGHGEHSSGGGGALEATTDNEGKFTINTSVCNNCWGSEISVHTSDSGSVEHQKIDNTSDIQLVLR